MSEREPADRLDDLVQRALAGAPAPPAPEPLTDLVEIATALRGLPREDFRTRLAAELATAAARLPRGDGMTTTTTPRLRPGFTTITPYLHAERIPELLDFITRAFGGTEVMRHTGSAGGTHAEAQVGDSMLMMGGFSKRILADSKQAISREIDRLLPLVDEGGFIGFCDHRVSPDVPLANYDYYIDTVRDRWCRGVNLRPRMEKVVAAVVGNR